MIMFCEWVRPSSLSTNMELEIVGTTVFWRDRVFLSWDKDGMSIPKDIIPKSISSTYGGFVLAEGDLEYLLSLESSASHERRWRKGWVSREGLVVCKNNLPLSCCNSCNGLGPCSTSRLVTGIHVSFLFYIFSKS